MLQEAFQSINQSFLIQATRPIRNTHDTNDLQTTNIRRKKKRNYWNYRQHTQYTTDLQTNNIHTSKNIKIHTEHGNIQLDH